MQSPAEYKDPYLAMGKSMHFLQRLEHMYRVLRENFEGIQRFALALYDGEEDRLSTFVYEGDQSSPLLGYELHLSEVPSLKTLVESTAVRVVDDMRCFRSDTPSQHTEALLSLGYRSSFTMPLMHDGRLLAFLFLNAQPMNYFDAAKVTYCNLWGHLVGQVLARESDSVKRMQGLVHFATDVSGRRSVETDSHVRRMSAYARMLARELQKRWQLTDAFIEYLSLFAPLHDIGKVGISDSILHKPGPLTDDEFQTMKKHVTIGKDLVDQAISHFALGDMEYSDMLRNIVVYHHEKLNGSGYLGCSTDDIPLEARIIAVADILDALLNQRSYKEPWPLKKALTTMQSMADAHELDQACIEALVRCEKQIEEIQQRYP